MFIKGLRPLAEKAIKLRGVHDMHIRYRIFLARP